MKYTIAQFKKDFPNDDACLEYIFNHRYKGCNCPVCGKANFYKVKGRKSYACRCGYQLSPVANTIFHKSETPLTNWFFAIYLMSNSKNGVSAKELQRHLGCTYKTAWRIGSKIRSLMKQDGDMLGGIVEADEVYIGAKRSRQLPDKPKQVVMGVVERNGRIVSKHIPAAQTHNVLKVLKDNVKFGTQVFTDDSSIYKHGKVLSMGMFHDTVIHSKNEYARKDGVHTNTIEGAFAMLRRSIWGTYVWISPKHLQEYLNEFSFHYNQRHENVSSFEMLLSRLCGRPYLEGQRIAPSLVRV